jgi:hypothetical protein
LPALPPATEPPSDSASGREVSYQSILDEYTQKLRDATPRLLEEFTTESANIRNDMMALAELSSDKIAELAEISVEGIEEMAGLMFGIGGEYSEYEEWAEKLMEIYMEEAAKITDAYMEAAMGADFDFDFDFDF